MDELDAHELLAGDPDATWPLQAAALPILRVLHRMAASQQPGMGGGLAGCHSLFGPEASCHLAGLLSLAAAAGRRPDGAADQLVGVDADDMARFLKEVGEWEGRGSSNYRPFEAEYRSYEDDKRFDRVDRRQSARTSLRIEEWAATRAHDFAGRAIERFKAVTNGIKLSGDDSPLLDAWEEYKDQVQGQHSIDWGMYLLQMRELVQCFVEDLSPEEAILLWIATDDYRQMEEEEYDDPASYDRAGYDLEAVADLIMAAVDGIAANEEIRRLDDDAEDEDDD